MIRFPVELVGEHLLGEGAVFFTEALAKLNARQFIREQPEDSPCCAKCAGCELDEGAPLRDAKRLLEAREASPASVVAYSMGRELAEGTPCRAVLIDGERLGYQRADGTVADPLSKFGGGDEDRDQDQDQDQDQDRNGDEKDGDEEQCCCGQHRAAAPTAGAG